MPKRTLAAASQHGPNRVRRAHASTARRVKPLCPDPVYGVPVPAGLHDAIEHERDNLGKAESLLGCLAIALEHGTDAVTAPYYPDVADIARKLVRSAINGLDSLSLQRVLSRDKVEEPLWLALLPVSVAITHIELASSGAAFAKVKPARALHRRLYSRATPPQPVVIGGAPGTSHIDRPGRSIHASA